MKKASATKTYENGEHCLYICRLKVVNKENGEETFSDNLEEIDLFLSQTW